MDAPQPVAKFAVRRPDWELPEVHSGLQLAPLDVLREHKERLKCPKCGRSRAHYCYDCLEPLVPFPHVALPFRVSIVTHHEEKASKNTGVQVAILAAGQVDLHSMLAVPTDVEPSRCAVLFPSDNALEVAELEPDSIDRLFIIDSRWKKAGELVRTETFRSMRAVKLSQTRSAFWRFHTRGVAEEGVCTVEALYFCLEALAKQGKLTDPRFTAPHAFDNLLWYFVYQHEVVQQAAQKRLAEKTAREAAGSVADASGADGAESPREQEQGGAQGEGRGPRKQQQQQKRQQQEGKQKQEGKRKQGKGSQKDVTEPTEEPQEDGRSAGQGATGQGEGADQAQASSQGQGEGKATPAAGEATAGQEAAASAEAAATTAPSIPACDGSGARIASDEGPQPARLSPAAAAQSSEAVEAAEAAVGPGLEHPPGAGQEAGAAPAESDSVANVEGTDPLDERGGEEPGRKAAKRARV